MMDPSTLPSKWARRLPFSAMTMTHLNLALFGVSGSAVRSLESSVRSLALFASLSPSVPA